MRTYKYKLYNSSKNKNVLQKINTACCIYNHCVALSRRYYSLYGKTVNFNKLQGHVAKLRRTTHPEWKAVNSQTVQAVIDRLEGNYKSFFGLQKNGHKRARPPHFIKRENYKSITFKQCGWKLHDDNSITIDGRKYRYWKSMSVEGNIRIMTIKRDHKGQLFIHIVTDHESTPKPRTHNSAGFDFGLKHFLTDNSGKTYDVERSYEKHHQAMRKAQQAVSRKDRGSHRRRKAIQQLNTVHAKVVNSRRDWQYKLANELTSNYDLIAMETLNFQGMSRLWGRKIHDLSPSTFRGILAWAARRDGKELVFIDKWFPSSKMCSACGTINQGLTLKDRTWTCDCGAFHDRDVNAAINILAEGASSAGLGDSKTGPSSDGSAVAA